VPEIDNELKAPDEPIRTMPLALHGPQSVHESVRVRLPQAWPAHAVDRVVVNDAFRLSKSVRVHDKELSADYVLEIAKDRIEPPAVATFVSDVAKAQALLGDGLSTAHAPSDGWWKGGAAIVAALAALLALAAWARVRRRARNAPDARLVPQPAPRIALPLEAVEPQRLAA